MLHRQNIKPYLEALRELGLEVVSTEPTGKSHYKIIVTSKGKRRFFVASRSESDSRSLKNFRALARRWKRSIDE